MKDNALYNSGKSVSLSYLTYLSIRELIYNRRSTFIISLVVAFIVLPLIMLSTVGVNFLNYVRYDMECRFDLQKIRAIVGNPSRDSIKPEDLSLLRAREDISFVQPISTRGVQIIMQDGSTEEFDAIATSNGDPTLKRKGFSGPFPERGDWLILHKDFAKEVYTSPETNEVSLIVSSTSETGDSKQYVIPFKIAGTYDRGGGREIYLPLELMDRFDNWRCGYAVPEWKLPGLEDQEAALGPIYFTAVRVFPPYEITEREKRNLTLAGYNYVSMPMKWSADTEAPTSDQHGKYNQVQTEETDEVASPEKQLQHEVDVNSTSSEKKKTAVEGNSGSLASQDNQGIRKTGGHKSGGISTTADPIFALRVSREDKRIMSKYDVQTVKDLLIRAGTAIAVPEPIQTILTVDGKSLKISASTQQDPWKKGLLIKGNWLEREKSTLQVVLPTGVCSGQQDT
jgi:hypothetical protein